MLIALLSAAIAAAAVLVLWRFTRAMVAAQKEANIQRLLQVFGQASAAVQRDPRQLLVWYPLAESSRKLFPEAFAELDRVSGGQFPFTKEHVQTAHARCSSDWLAWERAHDAEFSLRTAQIEDDIARGGGPPSPLLRTRLAALEQQKLESYQQRYEEYIKTAKALAALEH
jgi:hypothetical protein